MKYELVKKIFLGLIITFSFIFGNITECDRLTGSNYDKELHDNKVGIKFDSIDVAIAIKICSKEVNSHPNNARLLFNLGRAYDKSKDYRKAAYYYQLASDKGYAYANINLGLLYEDDVIRKKDYKKSVYYYRKAIEQNITLGYQYMGYLYAEGKGVSKDCKMAGKKGLGERNHNTY